MLDVWLDVGNVVFHYERPALAAPNSFTAFFMLHRPQPIAGCRRLAWLQPDPLRARDQWAGKQADQPTRAEAVLWRKRHNADRA
jgi:hypothetical protein